MKIVQKWRRAKSDRERLRAQAQRANVTIVRDSRGHVIAAK